MARKHEPAEPEERVPVKAHSRKPRMPKLPPAAPAAGPPPQSFGLAQAPGEDNGPPMAPGGGDDQAETERPGAVVPQFGLAPAPGEDNSPFQQDGVIDAQKFLQKRVGPLPPAPEGAIYDVDPMDTSPEDAADHRLNRPASGGA